MDASTCSSRVEKSKKGAPRPPWMLRAMMRMLRAIVWMLRAGMWMLRAGLSAHSTPLAHIIVHRDDANSTDVHIKGSDDNGTPVRRLEEGTAGGVMIMSHLLARFVRVEGSPTRELRAIWYDSQQTARGVDSSSQGVDSSSQGVD
eukprot:8262894-Pyramimonas_sp.AAC.2